MGDKDAPDEALVTHADPDEYARIWNLGYGVALEHVADLVGEWDHRYECAHWNPYPTADGPYPCDCGMDELRALVTKPPEPEDAELVPGGAGEHSDPGPVWKRARQLSRDALSRTPAAQPEQTEPTAGGGSDG